MKDNLDMNKVVTYLGAISILFAMLFGIFIRIH